MNGYVIELFVESLKGRANVKKLEVFVRPSCIILYNREREFQKVMSSFTKLRNIKSVAFILNGIVMHEDILIGAAWAQAALPLTSAALRKYNLS